MKELEFKYLVDKNILIKAKECIEEKFTDAIKKEILQINYYYDSDSFELNKAGITVRIRQKGNSLRLQIKRHLKTGAEYSCCNEEETEINKVYGAMEFKGEYYTLQGALHTKRVSYSLDSGIKVEFDTNNYLGIEDYEIEIEFTEDKKQDVFQIINLLGLPEVSKSKGKATRFIKRKKEISHNNLVF